MPRTKRSPLPKITHVTLREQPDRIRLTPNGGYAWRCHYCKQYASSVSLMGLYLCRRHGGSTPRQRDRFLSYREFERTGKRPRPPGRPMKHGMRSRLPRVNVEEYLAKSKEKQREEVLAFHLRFRRW